MSLLSEQVELVAPRQRYLFVALAAAAFLSLALIASVWAAVRFTRGRPHASTARHLAPSAPRAMR